MDNPFDNMEAIEIQEKVAAAAMRYAEGCKKIRTYKRHKAVFEAIAIEGIGLENWKRMIRGKKGMKKIFTPLRGELAIQDKIPEGDKGCKENKVGVEVPYKKGMVI